LKIDENAKISSGSSYIGIMDIFHKLPKFKFNLVCNEFRVINNSFTSLGTFKLFTKIHIEILFFKAYSKK